MSTSIFGRMVKFGRWVRPSGCLFSAVRFLFIPPSSFGCLGQTQNSWRMENGDWRVKTFYKNLCSKYQNVLGQKIK